jgi:hypothetical protein
VRICSVTSPWAYDRPRLATTRFRCRQPRDAARAPHRRAESTRSGGATGPRRSGNGFIWSSPIDWRRRRRQSCHHDRRVAGGAAGEGGQIVRSHRLDPWQDQTVHRVVAKCAITTARTPVHESKPMMWRESGPMDMTTAASIVLVLAMAYSAWLTSIVFCASNGMRPLLIASAAFFPIGIVHGVGIWLGGW